MNGLKSTHALGTVVRNKEIILFYRHITPRGVKLQMAKSSDGQNFSLFSVYPKIKSTKGISERIADSSSFRLARIADGQYFLSYLLTGKKNTALNAAVSKDLIGWHKLGPIAPIKECGMIVPAYTYQGQYVLYYGEKRIKVAFSKDLAKWQVEKNPVARFDQKESGEYAVKIADISVTDEGILLTYFGWTINQDHRPANYCIRLILIDKDNPTKVLWQSDRPVWEQPVEWEAKTTYPISVVNYDNEMVSFWEIENEGIFSIKHYPSTPVGTTKFGYFLPVLNKSYKSPILKPIVENYWESQAVFNPAAIFEGGKVHLIYRAVGNPNISVFGYASSSDGVHFDTGSTEPIYVPREEFECGSSNSSLLSKYASGPGWGGCEDPRIVKLEGRFYLTYTAWNGQGPPRVALTSIDEADFYNQDWNWKKSVAISPPNARAPDGVNKNWVIFPEKVNGKYAILHSLSPTILIDYFDSLDFTGETFIDSYSDSSLNRKTNHWNMRIRGAGPPPIKTKDGWLVLYRASTRECGYTIGAMLLDGENPNKMLYNSTNPILSPETWYENEGLKPRIVYGCGAFVAQNQLFVYYGSADQYTCLATAPITKFLTKLETTGTPHLEPAMALAF